MKYPVGAERAAKFTENPTEHLAAKYLW